jgi:diguanylate cyclase (GGDEF)-like protein/PAS domain S-box-containing protein
MKNIDYFKKFSKKQFLLLGIIASVIATEIIVSIIEFCLKSEVTSDYLITGFITSTLVSALIIGLVNFFMTHLSSLQEQNDYLNNLITELKIASVAFDTDESIIITDANSLILRVNTAFEKTTGYTAKEVVNKTPRLFKSGLHDEKFYADMWHAIKIKGRWQGEILDKRKNGEIYPKWLTITAVKNDDDIVTHYVGAHMDISERKVSEEKIHRLAFYDSLTNLPNRALLLDRLKSALAQSQRTDKKGAVMFVDMDNFKTLNDTLGHDMGDLLLKQVARRLEFCMRDCDTVARFGGDEFVVMLQNLEGNEFDVVKQIETVGEKILVSLNEDYRLAHHNYHSTPSIGVTIFHGHDVSIDELLKQADIAMYQAKAAGRNTLKFFSSEMQEKIDFRIMLETDLRSALSEKQLELYYQPQIDIDGQIIGAEALIRWNHTQQGIISPATFIPLAEETGLILSIGLWVLETACLQLKEWEKDTSTQHLKLAVNVSPKQFQQPNFVNQICHLVKNSQIQPNKLKLELTESILINDIEETIEKMNALRAIGIRFSMDDFGTGYSSLSYLTRLPIDQLKIDQSFVRNIGSKSSDSDIIHTIMNMSKSLGLDVIAEGVETEAQRDFLGDNGCVTYQGFLYGKPIPIGDFEPLIHKQFQDIGLVGDS